MGKTTCSGRQLLLIGKALFFRKYQFKTTILFWLIVFVSFQTNVSAQTTITRLVLTENDDAEEEGVNGNNPGSLYLDSSDLELVQDDGSGNGTQIVGIRFTNITVPVGATITNAYINFRSDNEEAGNPSNSSAVTLTINGHDIDNTTTFTSANNNISSRATTTASTSWTPGAWTTGSTYSTSSLASIVQEIVDRGAWASGNAIAFIITGPASGGRTADSYDSGDPPELTITYTIAAPTCPIVSGQNTIYGNIFTDTDSNGNYDIGESNYTATGIDINLYEDANGNGLLDDGAPILQTITTDGNGQYEFDITSNSSQTISSRVSTGNDDAEEDGGNVDLSNGDLDLGDKIVGIRFNNITIPQGAIITNAYIEFEADADDNNNTTNLTIAAQATDNAPTFTSSDYNVSSRTKTSSSVSWNNLPDWNTESEKHQTPDISSVIQEIINRGGWNSNNSIAIIIEGSGKREAESYNGESANAPLLVIEYSTSSYPANYIIEIDQLTIPSTYTLTSNNLHTASFTAVDQIDCDNDFGIDATTCPIVSGQNTIYGNIFIDTDSNGNYDIGETNYTSTGIDINLYEDANGNGLLDDGAPISQTITTDGNGQYQFGIPSVSQTISSRVSADNDDSEENVSDGVIDLTSSDLELIAEGGDQIVGIRFNNITIPQGATITNAYVEFETDELDSGTTNLIFAAQATDNAPTFTSSDYNISSRTKTGNSVSWNNIPAWNTVSEKHQTPDISSVIQEVINRGGWNSNNSIAIIIEGSGTRIAESYDGEPGAAPLLVIEYSTSSYPANYIIEINQSTIPSTHSLTSSNLNTALFTAVDQIDCDNDFGIKLGFDSDGDGIYDSIDIDDDNDGIKDTDESSTLDSDGDGILNYLDLDSDNDGIPDIVEAGLGNLSSGIATFSSGIFIDSDDNGMHDAAESNIALDSDGDGAPNYLDLDSDNDAVFDVDEARTERLILGILTFENGDGDINGDGVGDGVESETFRDQDADNDGIVDTTGFGDGILDIYDYGTGSNEYGNLSQGSAPYYVKNYDGLDTPDYIDLDSDNDGIFDIEKTLYAQLDADNDGIIDDTNDADGDGLVDSFDTNDAAFGSPRDLDQKLHIYFDGRNDYAEDTNVIDGWSEATLMGWIKIDPTASGDQIIFGQDAFYLQLNSDKSITANANGYSVTNGSALTTNQWTHIAAAYSNTNSIFKLFINGVEISNTNITGALPADTSSLTLGRQPDTDSKYFKGYLDEVRVFFKALSNNELQKMVYQEIEADDGKTSGVIIPKHVTDYIDNTAIIPLLWTNLKRYYRLDAYKDDIIDDLTTIGIDVGTGAKIYNTKLIDVQSAPLPFVTQQSGSLEVAVNDAARGINGNDAVNNEYSIIKVQHDGVTFNGTQKHVGLIIDALDAGSNPIKFSVTNDSELNVSWYLKLDGLIDLEGESQLIQGLDSELDVTSAGKIERDQQGTADTYTYNYWSTPVGVSNITTNNNDYTLPDIIRDGSQNINFLTSGYNGTSTSPIGIADYWIWKFANQLDDDYSSWQHVRSTGTLIPGEGFTMKGPGTGPVASEQNYVFLGKPNNGDINLTLTVGNDYLVGNPYASAIDAQQFILDNGPLISGTGGTTGTLFFWEHWGGGSHNLADYLGGYATYNLSGGIPAASMGTNDPDVGTGGTPTKTPGRYIPVSQGFFVVAEGSGIINFNNGQRVFQKESASSVFMEANPLGNETPVIGRSSEQENDDTSADRRTQLRIGFNSVNTIRRQLLLTVDENATDSIDWGYDGILYETQMDDLVWMIEGEKHTIQGIGNLDEQTVLPLGIHTDNEGMNSITLDSKANAPDGLEIYIHDKELDIYHDLEDGDYDFYMMPGENLERFEIVFSPEALGIDENELSGVDIHFSNELESIILINPTYKDIKSIEMFNVLGQSIYSVETIISNSNYAEYKVNNLSTGTYILQINTETGKLLSKKVLVE